eukprot:3035344-Prymnesium_polylepis.2
MDSQLTIEHCAVSDTFDPSNARIPPPNAVRPPNAMAMQCKRSVCTSSTCARDILIAPPKARPP